MLEVPASTGTAIGLAAALGVGVLIGIERERAKGTGPDRGAAGIRTFALLGLAGALADLVGTVAIAIVGAFVVLAIIASYRRTRLDDPGLTTEVAMLITFLLGVLAMRQAALAAAIGVSTAVMLASKHGLHRLAREHLTQQELQDFLMLVAAAFVVLPLLPDRTIDPWGALNPRRLWILVVAVMGVSSAGYVALRLFGSRLGLALAGLAGGFVSSTATIAAMAGKARTEPALAPAYAAAGLLSNVATNVQLAIVIGALSPSLLGRAAIPLVAAGATATLAAVVLGWGAIAGPTRDIDLSGKRPFQPLHVLGFVAILAGVLLLAAIARSWLGDGSLPWVLALSGLADVHAAAASAAQLVSGQQVGTDVAMIGVAAALAANSLTKCLLAVVNGGRDYAMRLVPGVVLMVVAFVIAALAT